ncbi:MAG: ABC transporter substrate-binding protein [bacterium]|nr:ABC transporter substrate-binding protein [bacterium]
MGKYRVLFLVLVLSGFVLTCGPSEKDAELDEVVENIQLDYTAHPLPPNIKWKTNDSEPEIASPKAKKGGTFHSAIETYPLTFRTVGRDSNNFTRSHFLNNQMGLLGLHPNTEKLIPALATHWAYDKDGKTMYFKINKKARWSDGESDGEPVTADDFIYTLEFMRSKHIVAPWYNDFYTREIDKVVKYDDYTISVSTTKKKPELWLYVGISPTPKHFYGKLDKTFIKKYNWKVEPNTGPYTLASNHKNRKFLLFKRKKNWWAKDLKYFRNRFNVDEIKFKVIRDKNSIIEHFKKGNIDGYRATLPTDWHVKATGDVFDKGYAHKLWFYTDSRQPTWGLYMNLDRPLFKDINVRLAFAHAINFDKMNTQTMRNEAGRLPNFFTGYGVYTNKRIKARPFRIPLVEKYMKKSGWKRGPDGIWVKDKIRYSVNISYGEERYTPRLVVLKEEAKKAGIELKLRILEKSTSYKEIMEKKHEIAYMGWSASFRPSPWQSFHSANAHKPQTNNINNLDDPEIDKMIDAYRNSSRTQERIRLIHKIQARIHKLCVWVPLDMVPFVRGIHWRWIKYPKVPGPKNMTHLFTKPMGYGYFWIDEEVKKETLQAKKDGKAFSKKPVVIIDKTYKKR